MAEADRHAAINTYLYNFDFFIPYNFLITISTPHFVSFRTFQMGKSFRFRLWRIIIPGRYPRKSVRSGYTQVVVVGRYGERRFPTCRKSMSSRIRLTSRPAPSEENREKQRCFFFFLQFARYEVQFLKQPCILSVTI